MLDQSYYDKADEIVASHGAYQESLIPIIQDIQSEYRYLPPELLSYVAEKIGEIRGIPAEAVLHAAAENTRRLFGIA